MKSKEKELLKILKNYYYLTNVMPSKNMRKLMDDLQRKNIVIIQREEIEQIKRILEHIMGD